MPSIFDHVVLPVPDGLPQQGWIDAYADAWILLAPNRTRPEGANQGLLSWQTMGHMDPVLCAKQDRDSTANRY